MRRILLVLSTAALMAAMLVASAMPAFANHKDSHEFPVTEHIPFDTAEYAAGEFCAFPVVETFEGTVRTHKPKPNGDLHLTGRVVTTLTNPENPENQIVDRGGGSGRLTELDNGGFSVTSRGHTGLFLPGETILLFLGQVTFDVGPDLGPGSPITNIDHRGRVIDICERLASPDTGAAATDTPARPAGTEEGVTPRTEEASPREEVTGDAPLRTEKESAPPGREGAGEPEREQQQAGQDQREQKWEEQQTGPNTLEKHNNDVEQQQREEEQQQKKAAK
jgi:hypothetical protein